MFLQQIRRYEKPCHSVRSVGTVLCVKMQCCAQIRQRGQEYAVVLLITAKSYGFGHQNTPQGRDPVAACRGQEIAVARLRALSPAARNTITDMVPCSKTVLSPTPTGHERVAGEGEAKERT